MSGEWPSDHSSGTPDRDEVRAMIQQEVLRFADTLERETLVARLRNDGLVTAWTVRQAADAYRRGDNHVAPDAA